MIDRFRYKKAGRDPRRGTVRIGSAGGCATGAARGCPILRYFKASLTHVFRLARAEQHSPTLAITEPRLLSGQPHNREGGCWPTAAHKQLRATRPGRDCGLTSRSHSDSYWGAVLLIDRRTSRDHSSGLMRSGHSGPLDKSLSSSCFRHSRGRIGLPSPKICIRRLALNKPSVGQRDKGAKESHGQENHYPGKICHPCPNQPQLQAQYARGLPHFR